MSRGGSACCYLPHCPLSYVHRGLFSREVKAAEKCRTPATHLHLVPTLLHYSCFVQLTCPLHIPSVVFEHFNTAVLKLLCYREPSKYYINLHDPSMASCGSRNLKSCKPLYTCRKLWNVPVCHTAIRPVFCRLQVLFSVTVL